jgi:cytochrome c oxidase cbb3-type subunit I/II
MPAYPWLLTQQLDVSTTSAKMRGLSKVGVPYDDTAIAHANADLSKQAQEISDRLAKEGIKVQSDREIVALIAYLQRLGTDIKKLETASN